MFEFFKNRSNAERQDVKRETVKLSGVVARCGVYMVPLGGVITSTQALILLEGQREPFWANATEVVALTKSGDEVTLEVEVQPEAVGERRFAFEIVNHSLNLVVPSIS